MNRRNGTSRHLSELTAPLVCTYREFAPARALRRYVRAYFSFAPPRELRRGCRVVIREVHFTLADSFCSPLFADGQASLVLNLGATCQVGVGWSSASPVRGHAIGALRMVGAPAGNAHSEMIGAYLEPGATSAVLHVPAIELTDHVVNVEDLWGADGTHLAEDLAELDETERVDRLEAVLLERMRHAPAAYSSVDVTGLAHLVQAHPASLTVRDLVSAAGVSRQHLTRVFRQVIGVSPKRYCRLARFRAGLAYAGAGADVKWAEVATDLGYADQSHMIAEFRELSELTPEALARQRWFHPFILDARSRVGSTFAGRMKRPGAQTVPRARTE